MEDKADLHIHSIYSDGIFAPEDLVCKAHERGLRTISVTDHDTVEAIPEAMLYGDRFGVEVVPGIEISCREHKREIHVLGYFIDIDNKYIRRYVDFCGREREKRLKRIVWKLNRLQIPLRVDEVLAQTPKGAAGRMHVAKALIDRGFGTSIREVFTKYLGYGRPAYEGKWQFAVADAINLIHASGGLAVIAHPSRTITSKMLYRMIRNGLDGIEVVHPCHNVRLSQHYRSLAAAYNLFWTGGSDFHGSRFFDDKNFGCYTIPCQNVKDMHRVLEYA